MTNLSKRINVQFQACVLHFPSHETFPGKPMLSTKSQCYEDLVKWYYKAILDDIIDVIYKGIRRQEKGLGKCQVVYLWKVHAQNWITFL